MTVDPRQGDTTAGALDDFLLDAKLSIPQPRDRSVSRATIIDAARSSERRVVGVTAPAGYGKTTLLAQWAAAEDRSVGWVSLDRFDDDPEVLLSLLASAYARICPGGADLVAGMRAPGSPSWDARRRGSPRRSGPARLPSS